MRVLSRWRSPLLSVILAMILTLASGAPALANVASSLINELMCPAECVMTLAACDMPEAVQMRNFIKDKVAEGWSKQQITDTLVQQYGERLLAAPTKQGFNLTAWITPFAAILAGGGVIAGLVTTWVRRRKELDARTRAIVNRPGADDVASYRSRLAAELRQFE